MCQAESRLPLTIWTIITAQVVTGFGGSESTIREHKRTKPDELAENKHFISVRNPDSFNNQEVIHWTKRGIIRLGFLVRSERAKRFRDFAEDLIVSQVSGPALPRSLPEALRMYAAELEHRQELELQLALAAPKTEFYDAVVQSTDTADLGTVAKVLNIPDIGRTKLFAKLREAGVLMSNNRPYQTYQDLGWFREVESSFSKPDGTQHVYFKTVVFQKGIDGIRKLVTPPTPPAAA